MSRMDNFNKLKLHPIHRNLFKKLSKMELKMCEDFINETESLSIDDFAFKCNRWMLDKPKPKNYSAMWALVMQSK